MMKYQMLASTQQATSLQQLVPMELPEYTMSSQEHASPFFKVTRMKSQRSHSILKATRSSQLPAIRLAAYGQLTQATKFRFLKAMRMKSSLAHSTTKEILSLLAQRITHAESGRISSPLRDSRSHRPPASDQVINDAPAEDSLIHRLLLESPARHMFKCLLLISNQ